MAKVIEMFVEDPITGIKVPNRPVPKMFHLVDEYGRCPYIAMTRNEAVTKLAAFAAINEYYEIVEF